jgi:hypothetical protein
VTLHAVASGKPREVSAPHNAPDKQALKNASKRLGQAAGGIEAAANYCRVGKTLLGDYGSPNNETFMPVDVVADLEAVTHGTAGWPLVTRMLAAEAGCALVELPKPTAPDANWFAQLGKLCSETGDVINRLGEALADGNVCGKDVRRLNLVSECDDAIAALVNMRARFEHIDAAG